MHVTFASALPLCTRRAPPERTPLPPRDHESEVEHETKGVRDAEHGPQGMTEKLPDPSDKPSDPPESPWSRGRKQAPPIEPDGPHRHRASHAAETSAQTMRPTCRPKGQGSMHNGTFKATARREGEWREDSNELLSDPLNRAIAVEWDGTLGRSLPSWIDEVLRLHDTITSLPERYTTHDGCITIRSVVVSVGSRVVLSIHWHITSSTPLPNQNAKKRTLAFKPRDNAPRPSPIAVCKGFGEGRGKGRHGVVMERSQG